ncbi:DUF4331 domain-containing protein [Candidatus Acetothermia bacterium]|nr:DUF4331 domain-containing protein [Candidatus Acetothermia bacterium]
MANTKSVRLEIAVLAIGILGLAAVALVSPWFLRASDHDDGEVDTKGRNVNLTDLYVFREIDQNPNASPGDLIFIMNTNPRSLYQQYYFSTNARYEFKITRVNNNDDAPTGKTDMILRFEFGLPSATGQQNITVTAIEEKRARFARTTTTGNAIITTPLNKNPILNQVSLLGSTLTIFAGMREDPFFFDVEQFFRIRAGLLGYGPKVGFRNPGLDFAAGYGVDAIVVRVPKAFLQGTTAAKTFDVWETISIKKSGNSFQPFERLARPGVNEGLLVSQNLMAQWNTLGPDEDLKPVATAIRAEAAKTLAALGNDPTRINTLVGAFLPDVMRIDTSGSSGYANALNAKGSPIRGRMITDDVIDITLSVLTNGAVTADNVSYAGPNLGGTGHKPLLAQFPYLADLNPLGTSSAPAAPDTASDPAPAVDAIVATVNETNVFFEIQGSSIAAIQVKVFNLTGQLVFDSDFFPGTQLRWNWRESQSAAPYASANGVYVYVLTAKGTNDQLVQSELRKLVLVR